ncbi:MAG: hypothetical protein ACYTGC_12420, partial [Planctomycetota bacterium]
MNWSSSTSSCLGACRALLVLVSAGVLSACASSSSQQTGALSKRGPVDPTVTPDQIQSEVMTFCDNHTGRLYWAVENTLRDTDDFDLRLLAMRIRLGGATGAITTATQANPFVAMVDMSVQIHLARELAEQRWIPEYFGDAGQPIVDAFRQSEKEVVKIAERVVNEEAMEEIRALVDQWHQDNPDQLMAFNVRLSELSRYRRRSMTDVSGRGSVFSLLFLDPLANVEPAVREVQETRLLGERVVFFAERLPQLINFHARDVLATAALSPEIGVYRQELVRFVDTAEEIGVTVREMPELISEQVRVVLDRVEQSQERVDATLASFDGTIGRVQEAEAQLAET